MLKTCCNCIYDKCVPCIDVVGICMNRSKWEPEVTPGGETEADPESKFTVCDTGSEADKYGKKYDKGKTDMSLLGCLPNAMGEVCKVMEFGAEKYERDSFADIPDGRQRYTAAMLRHYFQEGTGSTPNFDAEIGLPHDAMTAVNALFRLEIRLREELKS